MLRFLLDTNMVIEVLRHRPASLRSIFSEHSGRIAVSSITSAELVYGAEKSAARDRNLRATEEFLDLVKVLDFDARAAAHAGQIRAALVAKGQPIGPYDT